MLYKKASLVLKDGSRFEGYSFGFEKSTSGEVVFATGMVGYPESLTDPSYRGQMLCLTYPLQGNYGVPKKQKDKLGLLKTFESDRIQVKALLISHYSAQFSHWDAQKSLGAWLGEQKIPALFGIDTRALATKLRTKGSMLGRLIIDQNLVEWYDPNKEDLVGQVTIKKPITYQPKRSELLDVYKKSKRLRIILIDCGAKYNIIRSLLKRNVTVIRVPASHDFKKIKHDGILISNGPGNPEFCEETVAHIQEALEKNTPTFGICLGNQLLARAAGARTYKLKFGHRSQNQPAILEGTKRCFITTQNHGYAVRTKSLPRGWKPLFTNANDKTNEGIYHTSLPFFSCQFHPEATPGPVDTDFLFDVFIEMIKKKKNVKQVITPWI